jgi:hypothetical protein
LDRQRAISDLSNEYVIILCRGDDVTTLGISRGVRDASAIATKEPELELVFDTITKQKVGALFVNTEPLFIAWREHIIG